MKLTLQKLTLALLVIAIFNTSTIAQDNMAKEEMVEEVVDEVVSPFSISGTADTYFRTNLSGGSNDEREMGTMAPGTSFANLPGFSLGMANLIGTYETSKGGVVVDLVWGPRGSDAVFASSPTNGLYSSTIILLLICSRMVHSLIQV